MTKIVKGNCGSCLFFGVVQDHNCRILVCGHPDWERTVPRRPGMDIIASETVIPQACPLRRGPANIFVLLSEEEL